MKTIYLAHCYGGNRNHRESAKQWAKWALEKHVAVIADWIWITEVWSEERRGDGMAVNVELIGRADEVWLVGPSISPGMRDEMAYAVGLGKPVIDFTGLVLP